MVRAATPRCIHELVTEQATATPDATALIAGDRRVSYRELDTRASRLAELLAGAGVRHDAVVGVYLERGTEMVVALLAVLKAGAGYAMLDPELPPSRLRGMAVDAGSTVVVSRHDRRVERLGVPAKPVLVDDVAEYSGAPRGGDAELAVGCGPLVIRASEPSTPLPGAGGGVDGSLARITSPDGVACVMFTSGSTGRPKGIVSSHRAVTGTLTGQMFAGFGPGAVWLQCSPVSWDAFALELWGPLMSGGTCVLHPGSRPDPVVMEQLVAAHGITAMYLSGSLFNVVVDEYPALLAAVRELIVGGEALSPIHLARARQLWPELRLSNGYGPVEGMVFMTVHTVAPPDLAGGPVPIGRPLVGKRVHVLDPRLRPVADGETGEAYAAGLGLARGYAGRPGQTAERFVAEPYGPPGERMYRTGDLVRRREDGVLEFVGRADAQVKIRGFRVEPGEVEAVLARHPDLERAAVVADRDAAGDDRLVAYVVPGAGRVPAEPELRAHAAAVLPDFMVPARVVVLAALPLTATGKLDRAALPPAPSAAPPSPAASAAPLSPGAPRSPGAAAPPSRGAAGEPRTEREKQLCALYAEVLGVEAVGPDDSFFDLGGHSLLAARLLGRMRAGLGLTADLPTLFESPTVAQLATRVAVAAPAPTPPAAPGPEAAPASYAQSRLWFLDQTASAEGALAYNLPTLVRLQGVIDADALEAALADVVDRHEALHTVFEERDGEPVPRVRERPEVGEQILRRLRVPAAELAERVAQASRHRFDLARELPVHAVLFTVEDRDDVHALLVLMHHIAADGWSLPPFFQDLSRAYAARLAAPANTTVTTGTMCNNKPGQQGHTELAQPARHPERDARLSSALPGQRGHTELAQPARHLDHDASLPSRYADHARWQRERLGDPADPESLAARQLRFWRVALHDLPEGRLLPQRPGAPIVPGPHVASTLRRLGAGTHSRLLDLARGRGATLFMVLHAALAAVLTRAGAGEDLPIGAPVAGRGTDGTVDDVVGFFINMLVLRTDTSGDPTAGQLLTRVRDADLAALAHQEVPFEWVVGDLNPPRSPGRHPFTDVVLALQNNARAALDLPGVAAQVELLRAPAAQFALLVDVTDEYRGDGRPNGVAMTVEYATDVFDAPAMGWLADALVRMLDVMATEPDRRLSRVDLPDPPHRPVEHPVAERPAPDPPSPTDTQLEQRIAAAWADVLGVSAVGAHDDFFALGGNSLRAVRVAARLTTAEGRPVTAAAIFAAPTVAGLARALATTAGEEVVPIPRLPRIASKGA